jgi:hypothetical protein
MSVALANVSTTRMALTKAIQDANITYQDNVDDLIMGNLDSLTQDVMDFSSDLTLTLAEANALKANFTIMAKQYTEIVSIAGPSGLGLTLTNLTESYTDLSTELTTYWISRPSYPIGLIASDRDRLKTRLEHYTVHREQILNEISAAQANTAYDLASADLSAFRLSIYNGFVKGFTPDLELIFVNTKELSLRPKVTGDAELIEILKRTSVYIYTPVLDYTIENNAVVLDQSEIQVCGGAGPESYYVYLANQHDDFHTSIYDYRGRMFCSTVYPSDNLYVGTPDSAFEAILVGTATTESVSGKTVFVFELEMSLVSRESSVEETFREFSDFDLEFIDETTLELKRTYGTYGQIYVAPCLYYIGESKEVTTTNYRVIYSGGNISLDQTAIVSNTLYYVYIGGDTDLYNFNAINTQVTPNRPLHPGEDGYLAAKDFRLDIFLSTATPDEGRLAETYEGYWTRHIGQVMTDGTGKFTYSANISSIRQMTLDPAFFSGLAEAEHLSVSASSFKIVRKRGTSGIVMVGGKGIQLYDSSSLLVHEISRLDKVYTYDQNTPSSPLVWNNKYISDYPEITIYIYLANDNPCWGDAANRTFASTQLPDDAYLYRDFPGNNARWLCSVRLNSLGYLTGSYITDAIFEKLLVIDDLLSSAHTTWSSTKISGALTDMLNTITNNTNQLELQKSNGLKLRLEYVDASTVIVSLPFGEQTIVFPNLTSLVVSSPVTLNVYNVGQSYVYIGPSGLYTSIYAPSIDYANASLFDNTWLIGYVYAAPYLIGTQSVCSYLYEPARTWTAYSSISIAYAGSPLVSSTFPCMVAGRFNTLTAAVVSGRSCAIAYAQFHRAHWYGSEAGYVWTEDCYYFPEYCVFLGTSGGGSGCIGTNLYVTATANNTGNIYATFSNPTVGARVSTSGNVYDGTAYSWWGIDIQSINSYYNFLISRGGS